MARIPNGGDAEGTVETKSSPLTGSLGISTLDGPMDCTLGLTNCPGRRQLDWQGRDWRRDLEEDLRAIEDWGADILLTLVEASEFEPLGVPALPDRARARRFRWIHLPITDFEAPGDAFEAAWAIHGPAVLEEIRRGGRIAIHCAAGLGRAGTIAAKLLITFGTTAETAIEQVRRARPGAIEVSAQENYLRDGPAL